MATSVLLVEELSCGPDVTVLHEAFDVQALEVPAHV